jgi:preprotein translocase subunit YajC
MAIVYVDNTVESGSLTGANWQFTNGSTTVTETGAAGNALAELSAGDYVRTTGGVQWYKVDSVTDDDNFEIDINFQQGNVTAVCKYNNEDGSTITEAYPHVAKAVVDVPPSAGDIIKVRANQTHIHSGITITPAASGTANNYITLKGADSVDDPWSDGSAIRPIFDWDGSNFQFNMSIQDFWRIQNLDFASLQRIRIYASISIFDNCRIYDAANGGFITEIRSNLRLLNCQLWSNTQNNISITRGFGFIDGCILDGDLGQGTTATGLRCDEGGAAYVKNTTFGVTSQHTAQDILTRGVPVFCRNVKLASASEVTIDLADSVVSIEDDEQTHLAFRSWQFPGTLERSTTVNRSAAGGTAWSILAEPNSNCGSEQPLYIMGDWMRGIPIYLNGTSQTITVYAYADSTGGGWTPDASEFRIEIEHIEGAGDWDIDVSTDTFAAEDQWESFEITLTPFAAGPAYLRAILNDNVAGAKVYVDPTPVFS